MTRGLKRRAVRGAIVALSVALFAGMLFWTKLRVIENIPRSAYAVPEGETETPDPAVDAEGDAAGEPAAP